MNYLSWFLCILREMINILACMDQLERQLKAQIYTVDVQGYYPMPPWLSKVISWVIFPQKSQAPAISERATKSVRSCQTAQLQYLKQLTVSSKVRFHNSDVGGLSMQHRYYGSHITLTWSLLSLLLHLTCCLSKRGSSAPAITIAVAIRYQWTLNFFMKSMNCQNLPLVFIISFRLCVQGF